MYPVRLLVTPKSRRRPSAVVLAGLLAVGAMVALTPALRQRAALRVLQSRLDRLAAHVVDYGQCAPGAVANDVLLPRVQRLAGLLSSWQTVGGCGAGGSGSGGATIKWIGRNVH
ncbi:MAG: hypothetical protein QOI66_489, partial [Myxococcales bacterium]|nr:hypothetical protein [Myxococcales bacterium]